SASATALDLEPPVKLSLLSRCTSWRSRRYKAVAIVRESWFGDAVTPACHRSQLLETSRPHVFQLLNLSPLFAFVDDLVAELPWENLTYAAQCVGTRRRLGGGLETSQ
ncbi:hypothetical protein L917_15589, partial [Phytophthora nicotianae]